MSILTTPRGVYIIALCAFLSGTLHPGACFGRPDATSASVVEVTQQIDAGHFKAVAVRINRLLGERSLDASTRTALLFQRERMRRILLDFTLSAAQVEAEIRKQIPDLDHAEFLHWDAAGLFEHQVIDGRVLYFKRAPSNLFRLSAQALERRQVQTEISDSPLQLLTPYHRAVRDAALIGHTSSVLPQRVRVTQTLTVKPDAVADGEMLHAWIPFPREIPRQQEAIRLLASVPDHASIAPPQTLQRTAYLEQPASKNVPTKFSVSYEVTVFAQYHVLESNAGSALDNPAALAEFIAERPPHLVFTDAMRRFSQDTLQGETNPYQIVRKLFAAVDRVPWAGAREYSTISNIGDYALHAGHADCGQQTLLLMTLLRLNGIPARWQSGWIFSDADYNDIHDWGQFYLAGYGWLPMDVTFGKLNVPLGAPTQDANLEWFYLGGLDAYRIVFNDDFSRDFDPPKRFFRSDTVDSQRGEVEWAGGNLYYDQWDYAFQWQVLDAPGTKK